MAPHFWLENKKTFFLIKFQQGHQNVLWDICPLANWFGYLHVAYADALYIIRCAPFQFSACQTILYSKNYIHVLSSSTISWVSIALRILFKAKLISYLCPIYTFDQQDNVAGDHTGSPLLCINEHKTSIEIISHPWPSCDTSRVLKHYTDRCMDQHWVTGFR